MLLILPYKALANVGIKKCNVVDLWILMSSFNIKENICNSVRVNLSWQYQHYNSQHYTFWVKLLPLPKFFFSQYDLTHILWLLSKSLVHWPNKESQGKRKRTPNDQREKHCRPGEYMYYISKLADFWAKGSFSSPSPMQWSAAHCAIRVGSGFGEIEKKVNRDWKFILPTF